MSIPDADPVKFQTLTGNCDVFFVAQMWRERVSISTHALAVGFNRPNLNVGLPHAEIAKGVTFTSRLENVQTGVGRVCVQPRYDWVATEGIDTFLQGYGSTKCREWYRVSEGPPDQPWMIVERLVLGGVTVWKPLTPPFNVLDLPFVVSLPWPNVSC